MKEARFLYKCRLCGKVDDTLCTGVDNAMPELVRAMQEQNDGPDSWTKGFPVRLLTTHSCTKGKEIKEIGERVGIADLIGYKIVRT